MKKIIFLIIILLFPLYVTANNEYSVSDCYTEVTINKENNYDFEENISLHFNQNNALVTKELPGSTKEIIIDKDYLIETTDIKTIKLSNNEDYNMRYVLKNNSSSKREYKLPICSNYNSNVESINFHLNLPSSLTKENIKFYINDQELTDIDYKIEDNKVIGNYSSLKDDEVLSIAINYDSLYYDKYTIICIIIPIIFSLCSALLWYFYGKDLKYKVSRISKLPNSISLLDIALVNDGKVTYEEAYYLLLDLANRGYLKIIENKNNNFTIVRGKEYDGKDYIEASFLKGIFRKPIRVTISEYVNALAEGKENKTKELEKEISDDNIKEQFRRACTNILNLINAHEEKKKYFEEKSDVKKIYLITMIAIILVLVTSLPFIEINKFFLLPLSVIFSVTALYVLITFVNNIDLKKKETKLQLLVALAIITLIVMLLPSFQHDRLYIIAFLISIICVGIILFFYKYMPKRTVYGTKVYAKIEGFKLFLDNLRDEDLNSLLEQNPNYLLDILPVALIINCGELVIKKIKERNIKEPSWFKIEGYTPLKFNNAIYRLKKKIKYQDEEI